MNLKSAEIFFIPFVENKEDAVLVFTTKVAINKQTGS